MLILPTPIISMYLSIVGSTGIDLNSFVALIVVVEVVDVVVFLHSDGCCDNNALFRAKVKALLDDRGQ
jgi:hypothetical protein